MFNRWLDTQLQRAGAISAEERAAVVWSFVYFFCLLAGYFILRPVRDEMGIAAGRGELQKLFTYTFIVMLLVAPLYAALWSYLPRRWFVPLVYNFFVFNLLLFWCALYLDMPRVWIARIFFVWVSVFNLFAVSVFWSLMADMFRTDQGKRLFGMIAAGGTAGTMLGSSITLALSTTIGLMNLLLVAAILLEAAVFCALRLERVSAIFRQDSAARVVDQAAAGPATDGGILAGFGLLLSSRYLAGIGLWVALLSLAGTFLYFIQRDVVAAASTDPAVRTQIFAAMDLIANILTLFLQAFVTGKLIEKMGTGKSAAILPLIFVIGFAVLAVSPVLAVIIGFQALQRTANFAFSNPAREIFFTSVGREEKYKAKNVIDTVLFRGGDVGWAWAFTGLRGLGVSMSGIALAVVPVAVVWAGLSLWLGREQERRSPPAKTLDRDKVI
jgi:ATP:ADP antiporter, AAA family